MNKKQLLLTIAVVILLLLPSLSWALGTLQGQVNDENDLPISNAVIQSSNGETTTSVAEGAYSLPHPAGVFTITASAPGFLPVSKANITITDGSQTDLDFALLPAQLHIDSVYPSLGELGQDLPVTIQGAGFGSNTRVSLYLDVGNEKAIVGSLEDGVFDFIEDIAVGGNLALLADRGSHHGLRIVDISNPTAPIELVRVQMDVNECRPKSIAFHNDIAVLGCTRNNSTFLPSPVKIFDISDPRNPILSATVMLPVPSYEQSGADDIKISGNYAYVVDGLNGLQIIDIASPENAHIVGSFVPLLGTVRCNAIDIVGDRAYLLQGSYGPDLIVLDISNPTAPQVLGSLEDPSFHAPQDIIIKNNNAFIADYYKGLQIVDISNSENMSVVSSIQTLATGLGLAVVDDTVYYADTSAGLLQIDISDTANPKLIGSVDTPGTAVKISVQGNMAFVADTSGGMQIVDNSRVTKNASIGTYMTGTKLSVNEVELRNNLAYLATDSAGLVIVDITDHANPVEIGKFYNLSSGSYSFRDSEIIGNYAYLAGDYYGLQIVNIVNPRSPVLAAKLVDLKTYRLHYVGNNRIISVERGEGWRILDISSPAAPVELSHTKNEFSEVVEVRTANNFAYVVNKNPTFSGIEIYDISYPANPTMLGSIDIYKQVYQMPNNMEVQDNILYVTTQSGLVTIDVSIPESPIILGQVNFQTAHANAKGLTIVGNIAYVCDTTRGVFQVDISNPAAPVITGLIDTLGETPDVKIHNNNAVVADGKSLSIYSVPEIVEQISINSSTNLTATLPSPQLASNYTLRVFNTSEYHTMPGAVTFTDSIDLLTTKAIIVAGKNSSESDFVWQETKTYADQAYDNLVYQGYRHEDILYLSADAVTECSTVPGGLIIPGVDCAANLSGLEYALTNWAKNDPNSKDLLLYMVDHGGPNSFHINATEILSAANLDTWLDDLQTTMPIFDPLLDYKVVLVYDACESGSFISSMSPPAGKTRITMTSSSASQASYFLDARHSFSAHFWSTLSGKSGDQAKPSEAFLRGAAEMSGYQTAMLDANGNGIPNEAEDFVALESLEGTIYALRRQYVSKDDGKPVIATVTNDLTLAGETSAQLSASNVYDIDGDTIVRVWAEITAPDFAPATDTTVTDIPAVDLLDPDTDGVYSAIYSNFTVQGTYLIKYYAEDGDGIYSLPMTSLVTQANGVIVDIPDSYESDDRPTDARGMVVNNPTAQSHTFHDAGDTDWVKFYALAGKTYKIKTSNLSIINDTEIKLYDRDGVTHIDSADGAGYGAEEYLIWTCPVIDGDGVYYLNIRNAGSHYGANVRYELIVYEPTADFFTQGTIEGYVTDASGGEAIIGAELKTTDGQSATISLRGVNGKADGLYILFVEPGTYTVDTHMTDYKTVSRSGISVATAKATSNENFALPLENTPPVISGSPATTVNEDSPYSFTPTVVDLGDTFSFGISGQPVWATFSNSTGELSGTPNNGHVGAYPGITITVTDSKGATDSLGPFSITVNNTNDAPTITSGTPPSGVDEDSLYSYTATADDIDVGDSVTLSITGKPGWAAFDPGTGILSGAPENDDVGTHTGIIITADDLHGGVASIGPFSITVANVNDSPVADAGSDFSADEKAEVTLAGSATDPDVGDTPTLLWSQIGSGTSVTINNPTTATPSFTAPEVGPGGEVLTFQLTATDGYTASHSDNCTVTIRWVAEATAGQDQSIDERDTTTLSAVGDPDGTISSVIWAQVGDPAAELTDWDTLTPTVTAPNVDAGTSEVLEFRVSINYIGGQSATDSCFVTVNDLAEDLDHDNDIDGSDLVQFAQDPDFPEGVTPATMADEFGN